MRYDPDVRTTDRGPSPETERGTALILSLLFSIIAMGVIASGTVLMQASARSTDTNFRVNAQANQFARSGITDALTWFRRQTRQPVVAFEPVLDPLTIPATLDTDDPDVGLVREFRIADDIWGRYEVWKEWDDDPDSGRLLWRQQFQTTDVSLARGQTNAGTSWRIRSVGSIFRRYDPSVPLTQLPNQRLATRMLETEIKRLRLAPPGQAALCVRRGDWTRIDRSGRVRGGSDGAGIYYPQGTGSVRRHRRGEVSGTPAYAPDSSYDDSPEEVFGLTEAELFSVADDVITDPARFPSPMPNLSVLVATPSTALTFTKDNPLTGTAIVYVRGDVVVSPGSNSLFNGLLYVDGNLTVREPAELNGAVVVTGTTRLQGSGDFATIQYDEGVLAALRVEIGNYRLAGAIRPVSLTEERVH